jgi:hypothetical protein
VSYIILGVGEPLRAAETLICEKAMPLVDNGWLGRTAA